jgi:hypothetical protein
MFEQHVTRRPVKAAVKVTRQALNHALDVAEPRLESAAAELEDLSRDAYTALRKKSSAKLESWKDGYAKLERRARKELPKGLRRKNAGTVALVALGIVGLAVVLFR